MKAKVALKKEIELLKISNRKPTENGNKMLFDLVGDLYDWWFWQEKIILILLLLKLIEFGENKFILY